MPYLLQSDEEVTVVAPPLRLTFRWDGRRWSHGLDLGDRPLSSSVEWEPDRDDPARVVSPAYQQLSTQETTGGASRALLVGQWGRHHFSAVFGVVEGDSGVVIDVDVAARSRSELAVLASTYLVNLASGDLTDAGPDAIVWSPDPDGDGRLRFEAGGPTARVGLAEAGRRATRVQATGDVQPGRPTHRLHYRWRWERTGNSEPVKLRPNGSQEHR